MFQTLSALLVVALAATGLGWRWFGKKKNPGCDGDCGCPSVKAKITPMK